MVAKHVARYFRDGWSIECKCGWNNHYRTKQEAIEAYREHKTDDAREASS